MGNTQDEFKHMDNDVRVFVLNMIDSFEQMEILLLLHANQEQDWQAIDVTNKLRNTEASVIERLNDLENKGLLRSRAPDGPGSNVYQYSPRDQALARTVDALAKTYAERRASVINLIFSKPLAKIQTFADAFKLRKD